MVSWLVFISTVSSRIRNFNAQPAIEHWNGDYGWQDYGDSIYKLMLF